MCVIIFLPKDVLLTETVLKQCFEKNPDGWGMMYANGTEVVTVKDVTPWEKFLEQYNQMPTDRHRCVHMRIKTHGEIDQPNCHPFEIKIKETVYQMMHNGTLHIPEFKKELSDTWHFARLLEGMYKDTDDLLFDEKIQSEISAACGGYNRLMFMNAHGDTMRYGKWELKHECWFSNTLWEPTVHAQWNHQGWRYHERWDSDLGRYVPNTEYSKKNIASDTDADTDTNIRDYTQKAVDDISRVQDFIDQAEIQEVLALNVTDEPLAPWYNAVVELNKLMNAGEYQEALELMVQQNIQAEDAAPFMDDVHFASKMLEWFTEQE